MKLKTSISIIIGCSVIFLFIMLPIFLSIEKKEDSYISQFQGSNFSLIDVNNEMITEESFKGPITAIFFGFTNCPDVCPMTLGNLDQAINNLKDDKKEKFKVFFVSIDPDRDTPEVIRNYLEIFENKNIPTFSLLECQLETGRTHQIRVHMNYLGNSIVGDDKYKKKFKKLKDIKPSLEKILTKLNRQFLHAKTLGFIHPRKNKQMIFNSILPNELEIILKTLRNASK